jgi:CO/xanthine dehydrogenase FAD-binding subunit
MTISCGHLHVLAGAERDTYRVLVPTPSAASGGSYLKLGARWAISRPSGGRARQLTDGHIAKAGIGLTAVGPHNTRDGRRAVTDRGRADRGVAEAGARRGGLPTTHLRGSVAYKKNVVDVFVRRGLARAVESARAGGSH